MNFQAGISETSTTQGLTAPFQLGGALISNQSALIDRLADGAEVSYSVTDGAKTEWWSGVLDRSANTLSRGTFIDSTTGSPINWGQGRRIIAVENGLPHGLNWDGAGFEVTGNLMRLGKSSYPFAYFPRTPNTYLVMDAGDGFSDASILMRREGNGRWEIGMVGDTDGGSLTQDFHVKQVGGTHMPEFTDSNGNIHGGETFQDRLVIHGPGSPRYPFTDFFAPSGEDARVRLYGVGAGDLPMLVIGNSNGLASPYGTGAGLEISYDCGSDVARLTAITHDAYYRDIVYEANNHRWAAAPVFLNFDAMVLNSQGALILGDSITLADSADVSNGGAAGIALMSGYTMGQVLTALGGTGTAPTFTVTDLQVASATITNGGSGGTNGSAVLTIATGATGTQPSVNGTIIGGALVSIDSWVTHGDLTTNPGALTNVSVTGASLSGTKVTIAMGALAVTKTTDGAFSKRPVTPVATTSSGAGVGATLDIFYQNGLGSIDALDYWANGHHVIDSDGNWISGSILSGGDGAFTSLTASGVIKTTGAENSQFQLALGGQDWRFNIQSGGDAYFYDATNSKFPLTLARNSAASLTIGPVNSSFTGHVFVEGVTSTGATGTGKFVFSASPRVTSAQGSTTDFSANSATSTPADPDSIFRIVAADGQDTAITFDGFGGNTSLHQRRANGTAASPTAILSGNLLNAIGTLGHDGSGDGYHNQFRLLIQGRATENWNATAHGSKYMFHTTPNGASLNVLALTLDQDQSADFTGNLTAGSGASTGDVVFELGGGRSGSGHAYMDFHGQTGTDYDARIIRSSGANGAFSIYNNGTGELNLINVNAAPIRLFTTNIERLRVGPWSADTDYNAIGFNASLSATAGILIFGGKSGDSNLYFNAPTGFGYHYLVNNSSIGAFDATSLNLGVPLYDNGTAPTGTAGSGYVRKTSAALVTPDIGAATGTSLATTGALTGGTGSTYSLSLSGGSSYPKLAALSGAAGMLVNPSDNNANAVFRLSNSSTAAKLEATDKTGVSSYQDLYLNGATITFQTGGTTAVTIDAAQGVTVGGLTAAGIGVGGAPSAANRVDIYGATSGSISVRVPAAAGSNVWTLPAATDTAVGKATTDILTNKTLTDAINQACTVSTAQLDKTSNITLAVVTGLSVALTAGKTYLIRGHLSVTSGASGGVKFALVGTGGLTATTFRISAQLWNAGTMLGTSETTTLGNTIASATAIATDIYFTGAIVVNVAGTINAEFAQNVSAGTTSSVYVNSTMECTRVN